MKQSITGYHKDNEDHWVAELSCGHNQHVRHDPPFFPREWVTTLKGRDNHLGQKLDCKRCDECIAEVLRVTKQAIKKEMMKAIESAAISGLCKDGQMDYAVDSIDKVSISDIEDELKFNS